MTTQRTNDQDPAAGPGLTEPEGTVTQPEVGAPTPEEVDAEHGHGRTDAQDAYDGRTARPDDAYPAATEKLRS
jgi:hypothetical protein